MYVCVFVCSIGISDKDWVECQLIPTRICPEFQPPTHHLLLDIIILVNSKLGAGMQHQNSGIVKILKVHGIARHNLGHHLFCIGPQIATTATLALFLKLYLPFTKYRVFFHWYPPKKLKYGKPRLGESTLT